MSAEILEEVGATAEDDDNARLEKLARHRPLSTLWLMTATRVPGSCPNHQLHYADHQEMVSGALS